MQRQQRRLVGRWRWAGPAWSPVRQKKADQALDDVGLVCSVRQFDLMRDRSVYGFPVNIQHTHPQNRTGVFVPGSSIGGTSQLVNLLMIPGVALNGHDSSLHLADSVGHILERQGGVLGEKPNDHADLPIPQLLWCGPMAAGKCRNFVDGQRCHSSLPDLISHLPTSLMLIGDGFRFKFFS